jgi:hypothetical protein
MITVLIWTCEMCGSKPGCSVNIPINLQGGVGAFHPNVGCLLSSTMNKKAEWHLV